MGQRCKIAAVTGAITITTQFGLFFFRAGILAALLGAPASGLDLDRSITQFHHTGWTAKDGAPSQVNAFAQTADGYLWIGSERGLFRFDGVQFESYEPAGVTLPSHNINSLMSSADGALWISFNPSGLAFLKDGAIHIFSGAEGLPQSTVYCFARDLDGRTWAGTHDGLLLLEGSRWIQIGSDWNIPNQRIWTLFVDRDGTLWVAIDNTVVSLSRGSRAFQPTGISGEGFPQIAQSKDGRLWTSEWHRRVRTIPVSGTTSVEIGISASRFLFDRDGSMWMGGGSEGVKRMRFPERLVNGEPGANDSDVERFTISEGLTDNATGCVFEDREGNIWTGSNKGLDRFRHSHLVAVSLPMGHLDLTLLAGDNGEVWVASASKKPLVHIRGEQILSLDTPMRIASVYRESKDVVWWGGNGGVWRQREKDHFDFFEQPVNAQSPDWIWEVLRGDNEGGLWIGLGDIGLFYFKDGRWTERPKPAGLLDRVPSASYHDPAGRIWLGYTEDRVSVVENERVHSYSSADGLDIGRIRVIRGRGPHFWFGGELGLAVFQNGGFRRIRNSGVEQFGTISGIVETADGGLWLNELHGIVRIAPEEIHLALENPEHAVAFQTFDFLDGLPGGTQMNFRSSTAIEASDGRLWFATDSGLVWIDPAHMTKNLVPPPVSVTSLSTDKNTYQFSTPINLPQSADSIKISYAALSLSIPQRVRFRYRLEGVDHNWREAGIRREAFYTKLGPGTYRFRVVASNNDGIWNEEGAEVQFTILPAFYQTSWFILACVGAVGILVSLGYKWRVHHVKKLLHLQFEQRLSERTRMARELHDTLLQTVQGSKIVADDALEQTDPVRLRRAVEQLARWLGQAVNEGRAALNSLRTTITDKYDLAEAFQRAAETPLVPKSMSVDFTVAGEVKEIHPMVLDEVYRIGYEAIRNACVHSGASLLEVELRYSRDLQVRVSDNGKGIDPLVVEKGKEGHFGLQGMRERAARIGAKFSLVSLPGNGTEITVLVPGKILYESGPVTLIDRLKASLRR